MKKTLILAGIIMLTATMANAQPCPCSGPCSGDFPPPPPPCVSGHEQMPPKINLDEKLKLTDKQKAQAKEIRMNGHKQMQPLFEQLQTKMDQKRAVMNNTNLSKKEQLETIESLNSDINVLKRKIHEVRVQNSKDFEAILTPEQKQKLEKIKIDARKNFKKNHDKFPGPRPCPIK